MQNLYIGMGIQAAVTCLLWNFGVISAGQQLIAAIIFFCLATFIYNKE